MNHAHSNHELAHTKGAFGPRRALECVFCAITLLAMLIVALLPTAAARAQDAETQTPTANLSATDTTVALTGTPAAEPSTQDIAASQSPTAASEIASPTLAPTSTSPVAATPSEEASPSATLSPTLPAETLPASKVQSLSVPVCQSSEKKADVKLDGLTISVCAPILPGQFLIPDPSSSDQIATAASLKPYEEFSITAIAYGLQVSTETLPPAATGLAGEYLQDLKDVRNAQGGQVQDGPAASIFGSSVSSIASQVSLKIHGDTPSKVVIVEWVADAGKRLWIIRYSQELLEGKESAEDIIKAMAELIVSSPDIASPSTSAKYFAAPNPPPPGANATIRAAGDLPFPSWWSGDCDKNNYPGSYALGGIYRGVKACGPINTARGVVFFKGAWGELEWQCVELSMRFLYLAYGIVPYSGNGKDVVWNYTPKSTDIVQLVKISNGTAGKFPQAGDVLSYGTTSTYGHTSVVTGSNVDSDGNGTITIIEQNVSNPTNGMETLSVTGWTVKSWMIITGWLHGNNPQPTLSSISPTSVLSGTTGLVISAFGTNFISSSVIRWNDISLPTAFVSTTELIAAVSDSYLTTSGTASITVHNPSPGGGASSSKTFTINSSLPVLTGLSPSTALIGGSSFTLTATGSNFVKAAKVQWNGTALTTTYVSSAKLTASVPSSDLKTAGPVNITVFNPPPGGGTSGAQTFTVNYRLPTLSSISPTSALTNSSSLTLTVNGTNFVPGAVVRWNGTDLSTAYLSSAKLTALVPASDLTLSATIPVTVFNPSPGGGASASLNFKINNPLPSLIGRSPDHIIAGASPFTLTLNGKNFVSTSTVRWNGTELATTYVSSTQLTAQVTAELAANSGWLSITVFNPPLAGGASSALTFKVVSTTPGVCVKAKDISLGANVTGNNAATGSTNNIDTYPITTRDMHGPEFTYLFSTPQPATVAVNIWDTKVTLKAFLIDGGSGDCSSASALAYGTKVVFNALANHNYYFVVDGYQGAAGSYRITVDVFTPTDGSKLQTARPIFQWPAIEGAKTYTLQSSTSTSFSSLLINKTTSGTSYAVGTALPSNKQIYWRVRTNTGSYIYMPKGRLGFKTGNPPGVPKLTYPSSNGLLTSYTPLLDWNNSSLPSGVSLSYYQVQVALDSKFTNLFLDKTTNKSSFLVDSPPLTPNTKYYWRVQAFGNNGSTSNWSSASTFRAAMLPTSLITPSNGASPALTTLRPTFTWNLVKNINSYTIQISTSSSFSSTVVNTKVTGASYVPTKNLPSSKVLYWRVRAEGANGPSLWSPKFSFKTP